ncbi:hypothetical protein [Lapidilactobacillus luobeiensis]|uniref:hypothetical protein n=1 Tax=Lapidilactobacillus luobeiensis TaxID=2950371 RepID=UPI0021C4877C|nr:hypothetical protein [Lapidilactobacillus luobeiensis]
MTKFEKYHPILTEHYTLDWLTTASLKDAQHLLVQLPLTATVNRDYTQTAHFLQQNMLAIMRNQRLLWGITARVAARLQGIAQIEPQQQQARLLISPTPQLSVPDQARLFQEILLRLSAFSFVELALTSVVLNTAELTQVQATILAEQGFVLAPDQQTWRLDRQVTLSGNVGKTD